MKQTTVLGKYPLSTTLGHVSTGAILRAMPKARISTEEAGPQQSVEGDKRAARPG
jgi:hypothetical protein